LAARLIAVNQDVVAGTVGREKPVNAPGAQPFLLHDLIEQAAGVIEEFLGLGADHRVLE